MFKDTHSKLWLLINTKIQRYTLKIVVVNRQSFLPLDVNFVPREDFWLSFK